MAKNPADDNVLKSIIPEAVINWYFYRSEIKKLEKKQKECSKVIEYGLRTAREAGYTEEEINETIGIIPIAGWYLID